MLGVHKEVRFSVLKERRAGHSKNEDFPLAGARPLGGTVSQERWEKTMALVTELASMVLVLADMQEQ